MSKERWNNDKSTETATTIAETNKGNTNSQIVIQNQHIPHSPRRVSMTLIGSPVSPKFEWRNPN